MKVSLIILLFACSLNLTANGRSLKKPDPYTIILDTLSNDLQPGQVRVRGQVLEPYKSRNPIESAMISTIDGLISTYTDLNGNYELIIRDSDTSLYMYRQGYEEIAIDYYNFQEGHNVEIVFTPPSARLPNAPNNGRNDARSLKPVIYLYSSDPLDVSLDLAYLGDLTFTYPAYYEGWNVTVDSNGIHEPSTDRSFPYLFWEGDMDGLSYETDENKLEGQLVATDTIVAYLESQLSAIGLNRVEQSDFISFWAPKMTENKYVFIQFLMDESYENKVAELTIKPTPESIKRVYLLYTPFNELPQIQFSPQTFEHFNRQGFTVIEWGGSEIKLNPSRL